MMPRNKEAATEAVVDRLREEIRAGRDRLRRGGWHGDAAGWEPMPAHQASASPETQERALAQMESMLGQVEHGAEGRAPAHPGVEPQPTELIDVKRTLREACRRWLPLLSSNSRAAKRR